MRTGHCILSYTSSVELKFWVASAKVHLRFQWPGSSVTHGAQWNQTMIGLTADQDNAS